VDVLVKPLSARPGFWMRELTDAAVETALPGEELEAEVEILILEAASRP